MYKTLVVVDNDETCLALTHERSNAQHFPEIITFSDYLNDYPKKNEPKTRIINLCNTERYLSQGYYCSLLAEARLHRVIPSVRTINDLRDMGETEDIASVLKLDPNSADMPWQQAPFYFYFGISELPTLKKAAARAYRQFNAPVLRLFREQQEGAWQLKLGRVALGELPPAQMQAFAAQLESFTRNIWRERPSRKKYRWDMAILVDNTEKVPPSNKEAINRFVKAASKLGIQAEVTRANTLQNIAYYDALFIRETTAIDHHTYKLAVKAEKNGLVTIDDSTSILRCCNKAFLHDAFSYRGVPSPHTLIVENLSSETLASIEAAFNYPRVLKMPEGSFSRGVYKANNREQLLEYLDKLYTESALVLVQEYLYTEYDWRIGILNGRAIYASKYMMARNHWQIYNHDSKRFSSGDFETLPTFEVPKVVLNAALKAAAIIGNGLYGVDVKHIDGKAYVLEVNDNPSIDHKVEDAYLGDELYMIIMAEFHRRLEARGQ